MTYFHQIKSTDDKWYSHFLNIYSTSFPIYEQRSGQQQLSALNNKHFHLICLIEDDVLYSFICYWDFADFVYIEHFAVNNELRGQHIGTKTLTLFKEETGKTIILEIDPMKDEISRKRLRFYEKLGFQINPYRHYHPPYDKQYLPHELVVLSSGKKLNEKKYDSFNEKLKTIVMR